METVMTNIEYEFHYHGYLHYRLGEFGIHLKSQNKLPYVVGVRLADEPEWKINAAKERIASGRLAGEVQWILESHFEFPKTDSGWFSKQIVGDFIKYLKSRKIDL